MPESQNKVNKHEWENLFSDPAWAAGRIALSGCPINVIFCQQWGGGRLCRGKSPTLLWTVPLLESRWRCGTAPKCFGEKTKTAWIIHDGLGLEPNDRSDDERRKLAPLHRSSTNQRIKVKDQVAHHDYISLGCEAYKTTLTRLPLCDPAKASDSSTDSGERLCK